MVETEVLKDLGLNESEIKVYFTLLELETSTVGPIIDKSKVTDSKIYSILEKLKEKGLVSFIIKNNVKHFQASDPKNLIQIISQRKEKLDKQKRELEEKVIPWIEKRRKLTRDRQEATVYQSYEGVKAAFNFILDTVGEGGSYSVFMMGEVLHQDKVIWFFKNYHKKRMAKKIKVRLVSNNQYKKIIENKHRYKGMTIKYTSQKIPVGTYIFDGYVMTLIWGEEPTAFLIKSQRNYEYYKEFFEDLWKRSKVKN